jgi:flagellar motor switch protein FliN
MKNVACAEVIAGFRDELAAVVGALVEKTASARPSAVPPKAGYVVSIEAAQCGRGVLHVHFDRDGVSALSARMATRAAGASADSSAMDILKEICTQAATSFVDKQPCVGVQLVVASVRPAVDATDAPSATLVEIAVEGDDASLRLALSGTLELTEGPTTASDAAPGGRPSLDIILDMELPLVVRFGRTEMLLKALAAIGPGSVIGLGRSPDDPVEILVSNQVVATGDVVVVGGNYGVRIREVFSAAERVRATEIR